MRTFIELTRDERKIFGTEEEYSWFIEGVKTFWSAHDDRFDNVDNMRFSRRGDTVSEMVYVERRDDGCCGEFDTTFGPSPTDQYYGFGFNYGH